MRCVGGGRIAAVVGEKAVGTAVAAGEAVAVAAATVAAAVGLAAVAYVVANGDKLRLARVLLFCLAPIGGALGSCCHCCQQ